MLTQLMPIFYLLFKIAIAVVVSWLVMDYLIPLIKNQRIQKIVMIIWIILAIVYLIGYI